MAYRELSSLSSAIFDRYNDKVVVVADQSEVQEEKSRVEYREEEEIHFHQKPVLARRLRIRAG